MSAETLRPGATTDVRTWWQGRTWRFGSAVIGLLAGWVALFAWTGMVTRSTYLVTVLAIGLLMTLTGIALRAFRVAPYAVAAAQLVVGLLGLDVVAAHGQAFLGFVPTVASVRETVFAVLNGAATLNQYASPVQVNPRSTTAMLTGCGLLVVLAIDVLALSLRRAPLAALPLLVTLSVPVSILRDALALPVFVVTALLFLRLLASEHLDRFSAWGRETRRVPGAMLSTFWQVAVVAVVVALLAAPLVPVSDLLRRDQGIGTGGGNGGGFQLTTVNPFIRLRRDLVEKTHTPLVYAETKAASTSYLRTTVLDQLTSDEWRPSQRDLPAENSANGVFPDAPGLAAGISGTDDSWKIHLDPAFATSWLPTPYPVLELDIADGWRFDSRTLDVAFVGGGSPTPLNYSLKAFTPDITASALDSPVPAPASIRVPMTKLPKDFPEVIRQRAEEVTKGAGSTLEKAIALQEWFRSDGGFTYSLDQRGGSGMDLLAKFVTDDRIGYCEQFASAMAAMGRSLGIPSRVVVGFLDGTKLPDGRILYTSDERHAWPEMYFTGVGWVRFEPTPGQRTGNSPSWAREAATQQAPTTAPTTAPSRAPAPAKDRALQDAGTSGDQGFVVPWREAAGVLVLALLLLGPAAVRRDQRRRRLSGDDSVHLAEGAWAELRATAVDLGLEWPEHRTPREQARQVASQVSADPDHVDSLESLLVQVERGRYAPRPGGVSTLPDELAPDVRTRTVETVESWRHAMRGSVPSGWRSWATRLWPRSLLRGPRD